MSLHRYPLPWTYHLGVRNDIILNVPSCYMCVCVHNCISNKNIGLTFRGTIINVLHTCMGLMGAYWFHGGSCLVAGILILGVVVYKTSILGTNMEVSWLSTVVTTLWRWNVTLNTCGSAGLIVRISAVASPARSKFDSLHVGEEERDVHVMMSEPPCNS